MKIPEVFDTIRPFEPEELPAAYDRLLADPGFQAVLAYLYEDEAVHHQSRLPEDILLHLS